MSTLTALLSGCGQPVIRFIKQTNKTRNLKIKRSFWEVAVPRGSWLGSISWFWCRFICRLRWWICWWVRFVTTGIFNNQLCTCYCITTTKILLFWQKTLGSKLPLLQMIFPRAGSYGVTLNVRVYPKQNI